MKQCCRQRLKTQLTLLLLPRKIKNWVLVKCPVSCCSSVQFSVLPTCYRGGKQSPFCGNWRERAHVIVLLKPKNASVSNCSARVFIGNKCLYFVWLKVKRSYSVGINNRVFRNWEKGIQHFWKGERGLISILIRRKEEWLKVLLSSLCLLWKFVAPRQSLLMWLNLQRIRCTSSLNSEWIHTDWYGALWLSVCTCNGDQGKLLVLLQLLHQMKWKGNRQKFCRLLKDASPDHMVGSLDTLTMETFSNFVSLWVVSDSRLPHLCQDTCLHRVSAFR